MFILMCAMSVISLSVVEPNATMYTILYLFSPVFAGVAVMGWFTFGGVRSYIDEIHDEDMPKAWYVFARLLIGAAAATIITTCAQYLQADYVNEWYGLSLISSTMLVMFAIIVKIITTCFRTDGFTLI
jgi:hypothetical protein